MERRDGNFGKSTRENLEGRREKNAKTSVASAVYVEPRPSIARDKRPLRVRPKSAREYSQSAATMMAALEQLRFPVVPFGRYVARKRHCPHRGERGPTRLRRPHGAKVIDIVVS